VNKTSIEWTHRPETGGADGGFTWNPIRARLKGASPKARSGTACTKISPGCANCYASTINRRFGTGLEFTVPNLEKIEFFIDERILAEPLKRKKPATIFVGDMFDLFHEAITFSLIERVFTVACAANWHTLQLLTKRADRMFEFFAQWSRMTRDFGPLWPNMWPQKHIWPGVSVESQKYADERIPLLLQTPAGVRFLSVEPMLEAVDLGDYKPLDVYIDWVICGGESGPGARPFNLAWAESLMEQCKDAGVPFFMKQIGSNPVNSATARLLPKAHSTERDRKGGDPSEWPEHLRVRQFPGAEKLVTA
jgi:protein gp37